MTALGDRPFRRRNQLTPAADTVGNCGALIFGGVKALFHLLVVGQRVSSYVSNYWTVSSNMTTPKDVSCIPCRLRRRLGRVADEVHCAVRRDARGRKCLLEDGPVRNELAGSRPRYFECPLPRPRPAALLQFKAQRTPSTPSHDVRTACSRRAWTPCLERKAARAALGAPTPSKTHKSARRHDAREYCAHTHRAGIAGAQAVAHWMLSETTYPGSLPTSRVFTDGVAQPPLVRDLGAHSAGADAMLARCEEAGAQDRTEERAVVHVARSAEQWLRIDEVDLWAFEQTWIITAYLHFSASQRSIIHFDDAHSSVRNVRSCQVFSPSACTNRLYRVLTGAELGRFDPAAAQRPTLFIANSA